MEPCTKEVGRRAQCTKPSGVILLADTSTPTGNELRTRFRVPEAETGTYPIVEIIYGGGGATALTFNLEVTG